MLSETREKIPKTLQQTSRRGNPAPDWLTSQLWNLGMIAVLLENQTDYVGCINSRKYYIYEKVWNYNMR